MTTGLQSQMDEKRGLRQQESTTIYLVRETKGTKNFLKLRTSEADKVRCGQKHFEALDVPFAVAVSADEV